MATAQGLYMALSTVIAIIAGIELAVRNKK